MRTGRKVAVCKGLLLLGCVLTSAFGCGGLRQTSTVPTTASAIEREPAPTSASATPARTPVAVAMPSAQGELAEAERRLSARPRLVDPSPLVTRGLVGGGSLVDSSSPLVSSGLDTTVMTARPPSR